MESVAASVNVLLGSAGANRPGTDPLGSDALRTAGPLRGSGVLVEVDPMRVWADGCLDGLAEVARLEARTAALKMRLAADYMQASRVLAVPAGSPQEHTAQEMAVVAEVACVLTVSERSAGAFLADCQALTGSLPLTVAALQAGTISWQHARIIVDETTGLDPAGTAGLEAHFLDPDAPNPARGSAAGDLVPGRFRAKARAWRERHHTASIEKRHTISAADRRVEYTPDRDGMAWLAAYLPAGSAAGIWDRITAAARALQSPAETRTLGQLRADLTTAWLLTTTGGSTGTGGGAATGGKPGTGTTGEGTAGGAFGGGFGAGGCVAGDVPSPRAQVLVTVPVLSLLGATDEPAVLDGYGPIPPSMARRLVSEGAGSFYRVLTDPRDGAPLEIGRTSYRLTKAQRHWLRLRDAKCPFPGCSNHSLDNEADHLLAWADGGATGITNLGQPCPKHHRLKHRTAWTPTEASKDNPPGWTSPTGRHYTSEHQDWEPPQWPLAWTEHWPENIPPADTLPDHRLPADPGLEPPPDPYPERHDFTVGHPMPADPFPEWHLFTAGHPWPPADTDDQGWLIPHTGPVPEWLHFQTA